MSTHGSYPILVERLVPLMRDAGVALYMSGHDHQLQHLKVDALPYDPGSKPTSALYASPTLPSKIPHLLAPPCAHTKT